MQDRCKSKRCFQISFSSRCKIYYPIFMSSCHEIYSFHFNTLLWKSDHFNVVLWIPKAGWWNFIFPIRFPFYCPDLCTCISAFKSCLQGIVFLSYITTLLCAKVYECLYRRHSVLFVTDCLMWFCQLPGIIYLRKYFFIPRLPVSFRTTKGQRSE